MKIQFPETYGDLAFNNLTEAAEYLHGFWPFAPEQIEAVVLVVYVDGKAVEYEFPRNGQPHPTTAHDPNEVI